MANNITNLKLNAIHRGTELNISSLVSMKVNLTAVNLPGGGLATVKKYRISCAIAEVKNSVSRNVTLINTLAEKSRNASVGDVISPIPMEFVFTRASLFSQGRRTGGSFAAVITITTKKSITDMKISNVIRL